MQLNRIHTQTINAIWLQPDNLLLDVLRLDEIHPVISGNKWFKLKYYLQQAIQTGKTTIATFGGPYSNHIIAAAFACKQAGLNCVGFIRGEKPSDPSGTLLMAAAAGMELIFVSREEYKNRQQLFTTYAEPAWYFIDEGGYGSLGAKGASEILSYAKPNYTHIIASTGTGTMLAGLIMAAQMHQQVIGISSMKGNLSVNNAVQNLLEPHVEYPPHTLFHDYHFGGYAKHPAPLIAFINEAYRQFNLPLDIVYTGKLFFAVIDLINKNFFAAGSKLLMIHSGGLQGNNSLQKNQLSFL